MMKKTTLTFAKWVLSLNTVDGPSQGSLHRFVMSARLGLWPAIALSSLAFGHLLNYGMFASLGLAFNLCLVAGIAFLFNDVCDAAIDAANNIHRWNIQTAADVRLLIVTYVVCCSIILLSTLWLSTTAFLGTIVAMLFSIAYSLIFKRLLLVGNLVAAGLSLSPGLIIFLDAASTDGAGVIKFTATTAFLVLAFLLLLSREIKFDQFDLEGDRAGRRQTVPMLVSPSILSHVHASLVAASVLMLMAVITLAGKFWWPINFGIAIVACAVASVFLIKGYFGPSKEIFYKSTRIVMLIIPVSILLSF